MIIRLYHKNAKQATRRSAQIQNKRQKEPTKEAEEKSAKILYKILHPSTETLVEEIRDSQRLVEYHIDSERDDRSKVYYYLQEFKRNLSQVELDVRWLKKDMSEQSSAFDNHSQRNQESLCKLNRTLSNHTNKIAELTQEVGELGSRVTTLQRTYSIKRSVNLTETDSKKRLKVDKNTEE